MIEAFQIPTSSMENTLLVGDFLLVNKMVYGAEIPGTDLELPAFTKPSSADVIVFDPERFRETGTLEDPNRLAEGMVHVIINGEVILENGQYTGHRNGHVLRRG